MDFPTKTHNELESIFAKLSDIKTRLGFAQDGLIVIPKRSGNDVLQLIVRSEVIELSV